MKTITSGGPVHFTNGGDLTIGFNATHPNGKVVVSHLNVIPDTVPVNQTPQGAYWIVNNYGTNPQVSGLDSLVFYGCGTLSTMMAAEFDFGMLTRTPNAFGPTWVDVQNDNLVAVAGLNTTIRNFNLSSIKSLGQLVLMRDTVSIGHAEIVIK